MYVEEHNDWLVPNNPPSHYVVGPDGMIVPGPTWAWGDIGYGKPDGTNIDYIIGQHEGSPGPYVKMAKIFKCPTDRSKTTLAAVVLAHRAFGIGQWCSRLKVFAGIQ